MIEEQIHASEFRGSPLWHSEDNGKTWWSGMMFSHSVNVTRDELIEMAIGILRDVPAKRKGR